MAGSSYHPGHDRPDTGHDRRLVLQLEPGTVVTGGWCEPCLKPSLVRVPVYTLSPHGVSLFEVVQACVEDGRHEHLPGDPDLLRFPE